MFSWSEIATSLEAVYAHSRVGHERALSAIAATLVQDAQAVLEAHLLATSGPCVAVATPCLTTLQRVERIALLSEAHDVRSYLLAECKVVQYPDYVISRSRAAFCTRQQLLDYEAALEVRACPCMAMPCIALVVYRCWERKQRGGGGGWRTTQV
jgi:hypothetical protein